MGEADEPKLAHVLVVESEPLVRITAAGLLSERGYQVHDAGTAAEALACLRKHPEISVLMTSIELPDEDGWSLATRAVALNSSLRVIYTSGTRGSAEMGQSPHGIFLAKPYSLGRMVIAVANAAAA